MNRRSWMEHAALALASVPLVRWTREYEGSFVPVLTPSPIIHHPLTPAVDSPITLLSPIARRDGWLLCTLCLPEGTTSARILTASFWNEDPVVVEADGRTVRMRVVSVESHMPNRVVTFTLRGRETE